MAGEDGIPEHHTELKQQFHGLKEIMSKFKVTEFKLARFSIFEILNMSSRTHKKVRESLIE